MNRSDSYWPPKGYKSPLSLRETEKAIKFIKDYFQTHFAEKLKLSRVSAPVAVPAKTGINDHLSGVERPVRFHIKDLNEEAEIVQSLAKWKRAALADYDFAPGDGIYTDMNALRPDEKLDNLHSIYVDQWDWERVIKKSDRNLDFLKHIVEEIYGIVRNAEKTVCRKYKKLGKPVLPRKIHFIHSEELEAMYPDLKPAEREDRICEAKGAVFVIGIGAKLLDGFPHDERAADYDDWSTPTEKGRKGLNGDIIVWNPFLRHAFELSSMGIRVDADALLHQLALKGEEDKAKLKFHRRLIAGQLPLTIGGGIGQSRLCMFFLRKSHIGEVQSSIWPEEMIKVCRNAGIKLL